MMDRPELKVQGSGGLSSALGVLEAVSSALWRFLRPPGRLMRVHGHSMRPLLPDGALVVLDKTGFQRVAPRQGEVVAARPAFLGGRAVVKRVVGLPHGQVAFGARTWTLDDDEYFLLGDATSDSLDSRAFGPVRRQELIGRVRFSCWPPRFLATRSLT